jgi:hypothetical protein
MDGNILNRVARALSERAVRRDAVKASVGAGFAAIVSRVGISGIDAKKKKRKKRCRKRLQTCGGKKKCCKKNNPIACQEVSDEIKPECNAFFGRYCCGQDGATCDRFENGCDCCGELRCFEEPNGEFRCRLEPT